MAEKVKKPKKKLFRILAIVLAAIAVLGCVSGIVARGLMDRPVNYKETSLEELDISSAQIQLIAHRGFRAEAPENTIPAFKKAGIARFWGAECDVYRTKDGVWVVHHDKDTRRMMDKKLSIEKSTYAELCELTYDNGNNIDEYPGLKICTLEQYLKVCYDKNLRPIIELKGKNNQKYYQEIVDMVKENILRATYIAFDFEDLEAMRKLTDAEMYLLVENITDESIEKAKSIEGCGISYDANNKRNLENDGAKIKKIHDSGLVTAAWTVDDPELLTTVFGYGTTQITSNCITYKKVDTSSKEEK